MDPNDHPAYLYKYLSVTEGALRVIADGTIKFTSVLEFNDPFDSRPYVDRSSLDKLHETRPDLLKAAADRQGLSPAKRLMERGRMIANLKKSVLSGEFERRHLGSFGVCCLSRVGLDILMWSHYADFHRGFVIEFRVPTVGLSSDLGLMRELLVPQPVTYQAARPVVDFGINWTFEHLVAALLTKSTHWAYEQEERVIGHEGPPGIYPYQRERVLESVIVGMRTPEDQIRDIESAISICARASGKTVSLYRAREIPDQFALTVPGHPRLDQSL